IPIVNIHTLCKKEAPLKNTCCPCALKNLLPLMERTEIALTTDRTDNRMGINKLREIMRRESQKNDKNWMNERYRDTNSLCRWMIFQKNTELGSTGFRKAGRSQSLVTVLRRALCLVT